MITWTQFTAAFPEFATASQTSFNTWAVFANLMIPQQQWGAPGPDANGNPTQYDLGCELYIAHNMVLGMLDQKAAALPGGVPGRNRGVINSESAGPLSVGYDANAGIEADAGHWNLTTYGTRFIQMLHLIGAAPTVSTPTGCGNPLNGPAWPGPWPYPGYFG